MSGLEYDDNYRNRHNGCSLPHDSLVYDKDKQKELEGLSGKCYTYNLMDLVDE